MEELLSELDEIVNFVLSTNNKEEADISFREFDFVINRSPVLISLVFQNILSRVEKANADILDSQFLISLGKFVKILIIHSPTNGLRRSILRKTINSMKTRIHKDKFFSFFVTSFEILFNEISSCFDENNEIFVNKIIDLCISAVFRNKNNGEIFVSLVSSGERDELISLNSIFDRNFNPPKFKDVLNPLLSPDITISNERGNENEKKKRKVELLFNRKIPRCFNSTYSKDMLSFRYVLDYFRFFYDFRGEEFVEKLLEQKLKESEISEIQKMKFCKECLLYLRNERLSYLDQDVLLQFFFVYLVYLYTLSSSSLNDSETSEFQRFINAVIPSLRLDIGLFLLTCVGKKIIKYLCYEFRSCVVIPRSPLSSLFSRRFMENDGISKILKSYASFFDSIEVKNIIQSTVEKYRFVLIEILQKSLILNSTIFGFGLILIFENHPDLKSLVNNSEENGKSKNSSLISEYFNSSRILTDWKILFLRFLEYRVMIDSGSILKFLESSIVPSVKIFNQQQNMNSDCLNTFYTDEIYNRLEKLFKSLSENVCYLTVQEKKKFSVDDFTVVKSFLSKLLCLTKSRDSLSRVYEFFGSREDFFKFLVSFVENVISQSQEDYKKITTLFLSIYSKFLILLNRIYYFSNSDPELKEKFCSLFDLFRFPEKLYEKFNIMKSEKLSFFEMHELLITNFLLSMKVLELKSPTNLIINMIYDTIVAEDTVNNLSVGKKFLNHFLKNEMYLQFLDPMIVSICYREKVIAILELDECENNIKLLKDFTDFVISYFPKLWWDRIVDVKFCSLHINYRIDDVYDFFYEDILFTTEKQTKKISVPA